jgi:glycine reductase
MVGSNRVINAHKIVNPVGNPDLEPEAEKDFRRSIIEKALEALQADIKEQKLFMRDT